jgi:hypothetical protein
MKRQRPFLVRLANGSPALLFFRGGTFLVRLDMPYDLAREALAGLVNDEQDKDATAWARTIHRVDGSPAGATVVQLPG